jgi:uncharacterized protein YecE (DUF72 family)
MVRGWRDRVKENFVYAVKGSRFITHMKKLVKLDGALDKFFDRIAPMKERVGVILWQLPPLLKRDVSRIDNFLAQSRPHTGTQSNSVTRPGTTTRFSIHSASIKPLMLL